MSRQKKRRVQKPKYEWRPADKAAFCDYFRNNPSAFKATLTKTKIASMGLSLESQVRVWGLVGGTAQVGTRTCWCLRSTVVDERETAEGDSRQSRCGHMECGARGVRRHMQRS